MQSSYAIYMHQHPSSYAPVILKEILKIVKHFKIMIFFETWHPHTRTRHSSPPPYPPAGMERHHTRHPPGTRDPTGTREAAAGERSSGSLDATAATHESRPAASCPGRRRQGHGQLQQHPRRRGTLGVRHEDAAAQGEGIPPARKEDVVGTGRRLLLVVGFSRREDKMGSSRRRR